MPRKTRQGFNKVPEKGKRLAGRGKEQKEVGSDVQPLGAMNPSQKRGFQECLLPGAPSLRHNLLLHRHGSIPASGIPRGKKKNKQPCGSSREQGQKPVPISCCCWQLPGSATHPGVC